MNKSVKIDNKFVGGAEENIKPISLTEIAAKRSKMLGTLHGLAFDKK